MNRSQSLVAFTFDGVDSIGVRLPGLPYSDQAFLAGGIGSLPHQTG